VNRLELESLVRETLLARLTQASVGARPAAARVAAGPPLITDKEVLAARARGEASIPLVGRTIITPLARETADRYRIQFTESSPEAASAKPDLHVAPTRSVPPRTDPAPAASPVSPRVVTVAMGADHGGFPLKAELKKFLEEEGGYRVLDVGTFSDSAVDYPDFAHKVAGLVARGEVHRGIVIDGMGIGSCMAANRHVGVRAALGAGILEVVNAREHNDANVLCLGGKMLGSLAARALVMVFLTTVFGGGRHARRVAKIDEVPA
jgi:ribose 5-phosphate isomerase B